MDFCPGTGRLAATLVALSLCSPAALASYKQNQFEIMVGFNHSSHNTNHLQIGPANTEVDALHETGSGNDIIEGFSYGYNILPWFVAYHDKDLKDSVLQRVWVGLDLIFMNTTQTGNEYMSQDPAFQFYEYELQEDTIRLMVNSEVDFKSWWDNVLPFVQASMGAGRIAVSFDDYVRPGMGFTGGNISLSQQVNYNLVYSLGAGVKFLVKPNLQVGASYLFTDFGVVETGMNSSSVELSEPIRDHLYTSSALLNVSYLF